MKVLTPEEMREVDRQTIALGIPGAVLMENAGARVVEFLAGRFAPLAMQRIVIICGKGNNGGDGLVIARQLLTRYRPQALHVVLASDPAEMRGDAAASLRMFQACGGEFTAVIPPLARAATIVVDALLGTGMKGPAEGHYGHLIHEVNHGFPAAKIVAVDVPSGDVRADHTVTFAAPKLEQVLWPGYERNGELIVGPIGTPDYLTEHIALSLSQAVDFVELFQPRARNSNKGLYGHVLVAGGSAGKTGAAAMTGLAALRAGAGLVTVASEGGTMPPELMTADLNEIDRALENKTVAAVGPGLGSGERGIQLARRLFREAALPLVMDADGLNALAGSDWRGGEHLRVITPHPGEMGRLCGVAAGEIQNDRLGFARRLAAERNVTVVLKGDRTVIALPDGRAWINPTGSPALATGGTGDILTGLTAGLLAQFPEDLAVRAAVWLHGRAGELGAAELGEKSLIATDLLSYLPEAMRECENV